MDGWKEKQTGERCMKGGWMDEEIISSSRANNFSYSTYFHMLSS